MTRSVIILIFLAGAVLVSGCQQELISETYTSSGPSLQENNDLANGTMNTTTNAAIPTLATMGERRRGVWGSFVDLFRWNKPRAKTPAIRSNRVARPGDLRRQYFNSNQMPLIP